MRDTYLSLLFDLAKKDERVVSLVADNGMIVYDDFKLKFPNRYFNFGIAEENMVAAGAGMASCGLIPFIYTIGSFLAYRSYEFIRDDVCIQDQNVKIVGIGTGLTYSTLGPTHHTTEDIGLLRGIPNLTIFCPSTPLECKWAVEKAYSIIGPVYIRLGNNKTEYCDVSSRFEIGKPVVIKEGKDVTIFTTGTMLNVVMECFELLLKMHISAKVISVLSLKPLDNAAIVESMGDCPFTVSIEDHNTVNGLGTAIAEAIVAENKTVSLLKIGLDDVFAAGYGRLEDVRMMNGLDAKSITKKITDFVRRMR